MEQSQDNLHHLMNYNQILKIFLLKSKCWLTPKDNSRLQLNEIFLDHTNLNLVLSPLDPIFPNG